MLIVEMKGEYISQRQLQNTDQQFDQNLSPAKDDENILEKMIRKLTMKENQ